MRVLVVEDEVRMAAMLRRGLVEDGHSVDVTGDGLEAVWQATEIDYDAVVLDLMLPGIDGFEVCPPAAGGTSVGAGADADRPKRCHRPGPRSGRWRR